MAPTQTDHRFERSCFDGPTIEIVQFGAAGGSRACVLDRHGAGEDDYERGNEGG